MEAEEGGAGVCILGLLFGNQTRGVGPDQGVVHYVYRQSQGLRDVGAGGP